jgi:hypothetical protein
MQLLHSGFSRPPAGNIDGIRVIVHLDTLQNLYSIQLDVMNMLMPQRMIFLVPHDLHLSTIREAYAIAGADATHDPTLMCNEPATSTTANKNHPHPSLFAYINHAAMPNKLIGIRQAKQN